MGDDKRSFWKELAIAVAPVVAGIIGDAVRDWLHHRRQQQAAMQPDPKLLN